jgi:hypothetical protein
LREIATWKREAPLANPTVPTRQFDSKVFYDPAEQVSSLIHTALAGSSGAESDHHYVYDDAGNIGSKHNSHPTGSPAPPPRHFEHLWVVYPGTLRYPLTETITALPLREISRIGLTAQPGGGGTNR